MSERLKRMFRKHDIAMFSKPGYTLRQALVSPKDPLVSDEKCGVVYSVKCETCSEEYVGETIRPLSTRMKEHKDSVQKKNLKSALGEHIVNNPSHAIDFEQVKAIDSHSHTIPRKVLEAIHIRNRSPALNRQGGYDLPKVYHSLLQQQQEERGASHQQHTALLGSRVNDQ